MREIFRLILGSLLLMALGFTVLKNQAEPVKNLMRDADLIRVGISDETMTQQEYPSVTVSSTSSYRILQGDKPIWHSPAFLNVRITRILSGFLIHPVTGGAIGPYGGVLTVEPETPEGRLRLTHLTRKGQIPSYRGIFEILPASSSLQKLMAVNVLPMQEYLKAVVPNELPIQYGYEAVKAQSVAARNYAIHPREKPWPQFDICDSQYCQAYYGSQTEQPQVTQAIAETQGLIALYQGEPILALYSSSQGGYRESYENTFSDPITNKFPATPLPYLEGGPDIGPVLKLDTEETARNFYLSWYPDSYDVASPMYRWHKTWSRRELESEINRNLAVTWQDTSTRPFIRPAFPPKTTIGSLKDIIVLQRGVSGKAMRVALVGSHGTWILSKEFVIRKVLKNQGRFLPSANVVFDLHRSSVEAFGGGLGHGVGMSQIGASMMSKHGSSFPQILKHYYSGIAIGSIPLIATATEGMKTTFYADKPHATLFVKGTSPTTVQVNDKTLTLTPQNLSLTVIDEYLKADSLNKLEVKPLQVGSNSTVWVELF